MSALPKTGFACMGGWCAVRDHCVHFHAKDRRNPAERLCQAGNDGQSDIVFVQIVRAAPTQPRVMFDATQIGGAA